MCGRLSGVLCDVEVKALSLLSVLYDHVFLFFTHFFANVYAIFCCVVL